MGHCWSAEEHSFCLQLLRHLQSEITERRVDSVIDAFLELLTQNVPFGQWMGDCLATLMEHPAPPVPPRTQGIR